MTLVVLIGGVGGPPGLLTDVLGTAPLLGNSGFLLVVSLVAPTSVLVVD